MNTYLQSLRPAGNPVLLQIGPLDPEQFGNFHVKFYQSGTAALAAALIAAKAKQAKIIDKQEVLLPAYACPDLISACVYAGVSPILIDLEPDSCWMQIEHIKNSITQNTIGIIAVRFLGIAERMAQLRRICDQHNLSLIEDSAQGFPTHDPQTYWQGDLNIISFGRGKPVNLLGGGAVITRNVAFNRYLPDPDSDIGESGKTEQLKYHAKVQLYNLLIKPPFYSMATKLPGLNVGETIYKPLHAVQPIPVAIAERLSSNINNYIKSPNLSPQIHERLASLSSPHIIDLPCVTQHDFSNLLLRYPLLITKKQIRDQLYLNLQTLGASLMYQEPLYRVKSIPSEITRFQEKTPNAEKFANQLITLPTHTGVSTKMLEKIFLTIKETFS